MISLHIAIRNQMQSIEKKFNFSLENTTHVWIQIFIICLFFCNGRYVSFLITTTYGDSISSPLTYFKLPLWNQHFACSFRCFLPSLYKHLIFLILPTLYIYVYIYICIHTHTHIIYIYIYIYVCVPSHTVLSGSLWSPGLQHAKLLSP